MKIAIAGYGVEGRENYKYFHNLYSEAEMAIIDKKQVDDLPVGAKYLSYEDFLRGSHEFDLILRSPSFRPDSFLHTRGKVWSATNEFFEKCPAPIIGVTGTKGKGTTCSLIASILKAAGKTVHLVGNIGVPALSTLSDIRSDDIVVFELSSFQLWDIERSPHIALVLMIEPDHLDVHKDFNEYIDAKRNIVRFQSANDAVIHHPSNSFSSDIAEGGQGSKLRYGAQGGGGAYAEDGNFCQNEKIICSVDNLQLIGEHNIENACAAISALTKLPDWPEAFSGEVVARGLSDFQGLPHRLEFVRELRGVSYFNDSYSSAPGATVAAVKALANRRAVLICGGYDRGLDYSSLAMSIVETGNVSKVILIGETAANIRSALVGAGYEGAMDLSQAKDMGEIVNLAGNGLSGEDVMLLSPGCPSFDMFKNFEDRGNQFREIVRSMQ